MPATIPQPINMGERYQRPSFMEQLLLALAGQLPSLGLQMFQMHQQGRTDADKALANKAILEDYIQRGIIAPETAGLIPGSEYTPGLRVQEAGISQPLTTPPPAGGGITGPMSPPRTVPSGLGAPRVSAKNVSPEIASAYLPAMLEAEQSRASIGQARAGERAQLASAQRTEAMTPLEVENARLSNLLTQEEINQSQGLFIAKKQLTLAQAAQAEAAAAADRARIQQTNAEYQRALKEDVIKQREFVVSHIRDDVEKLNAAAAQIRQVDMGASQSDALREAALSLGLPLKPSGALDTKALRDYWQSVVTGENFSPETLAEIQGNRLTALAKNLGLNAEAQSALEEILSEGLSLPETLKRLEVYPSLQNPQTAKSVRQYLAFRRPGEAFPAPKPGLGSRLLRYKVPPATGARR